MSPRRVATEADAWDVRLAALATLAQYDGVAVVTLAGVETSTAYNVDADPTAEPAIRSAAEEVARSADTVQLRASVPLADGRLATTVLVTPLAPSDGSVGALIALRVGRPFTAVDAYAAVGVAEIVSLELARSITAAREATERRQALALYELARQALFTDDLDDALHSIAMVLATTLEHDAAHVWLRGPGRSLRRHAAYPLEQIAPEITWENDHSALVGALRERRLVRVSEAAPWMPANTREALVVPLRSDPGPLGILVLARAQTPYGLDDIEMADVVGTFIGRVVERALSPGAVAHQGAFAARSVTLVEREEQLAEGHELN
jgi:GAF domain-containing protein